MTGDVRAQLSGLAKRLADLGISGTGDITSESYEGILQGELATALKDMRECKLAVFNSLKQVLLPAPPPAPPQQPPRNPNALYQYGNLSLKGRAELLIRRTA
jgi:hypothetical protein